MKLFQVRKDKFEQERYLEVATYDYQDKARRLARLDELLNECNHVDSGKPERQEHFIFIIYQ